MFPVINSAATPVYDDAGTIVGVVGIDVVIDTVTDMMENYTIGKLASRIVKPLMELNETAMQLAAGNLDVTINAQTEDEVGDLGRSIDKTVTRLKEYINYIDEISAVLADMAEETSATSEELAAQSVTLNELVQQFELTKDIN